MSEGSFQPDWFSKPGDTIATMMARKRMNHHALAAVLEADPATVRGLLAGAVRVDEHLAARLSKALGGTAAFWRRRQSAYETALGRAASSVPADAGSAWVKQLPLKDMSSGWGDAHRDRAAALRFSLAYFGVTGPNEWEARYLSVLNDVAFRTSPTFQSKAGALSAWLRMGELEASLVPTDAWDRDRLRQRLPELRRLAKLKAPATFMPQLRRLCAEAGVAVVFVKAPSGCRASGATRFLSPRKAMVILSFRYLSNDHFWFTFFHELGHLVLHDISSTFVDGEGTDEGAREDEANSFSADVLVPPERRGELRRLRARTEQVLAFARSIGVAPGIVVGQMQHLGVIDRHQMNFLKRRYRWEDLAAIV